ncbi:UDP-phosphate galactose phosphotransferase [Pasteurellaceae bacterium Macca]|nr:UDP-phosphate galactose phosphotransferase [Pasteurellaceae bacterium Macca]
MNKFFLSKLILICSDFLSIFFSFIISIEIIKIFVGNISSYLPSDQIDERIIIHAFLSIIGVLWFWIRLRHYTYRKPFWFELKEILRTLIIISIIELAIISFSKLEFSRYLWSITWLIALLIVPFSRMLLKFYLIKMRWYIRDTIIIGSGKNAVDAFNALESERYLGFNIIGYVSINSDKIKELNLNEIAREDIWDLFQYENIQFIIALEDDETVERDIWLRKLAKYKCRNISIIPTLRGLPLYSTDMSFLFSYEVMLLRITNNLSKRSSRILKRFMDVFGSIVIIIMLSPILCLIFFLIKKDGGSAIYGHSRIGQNGKEFKCLKFRSMVLNSKEVLDELLLNDPVAKAQWDKDFKLKNDPRITKIGHFLRKTSLDELPQLFNVLKGEMSLVGPRPVVKEELERYQEDIDYYLMAKPGMTGLWQISGRNDVDYETRVYFDSWYVKNWSLWNDIAILFKTVNIVLKRDGAY